MNNEDQMYELMRFEYRNGKSHEVTGIGSWGLDTPAGVVIEVINRNAPHGVQFSFFALLALNVRELGIGEIAKAIDGLEREIKIVYRLEDKQRITNLRLKGY